MELTEKHLALATKYLPTSINELARLSDEDIEERASVWSFDLDEFCKRLRVRNRAQQVMIAHLYIDHILQRIVEENVPNPKAFDLKRMSTDNKIQLSVGLGAISENTSAPVKFINKLRNNVAHTLKFEVSNKEISKLASATSVEIKNSIRKDERNILLTDLLHGNVVFLEFCRQILQRRHLEGKRENAHWAIAGLMAARVLNKGTYLLDGEEE